MFSIQLPLFSGCSLNQHHSKQYPTETGSKTRNKKVFMATKTTAAMINNDTLNREYDRLKEVKRFDDSKIGVKGLIDSGITSIPPFFIQPPEVLSDLKPKGDSPSDPESNLIPTIDISGAEDLSGRSEIVGQIERACREFGFFQVVNHGIPVDVLDRTIKAIKGFHELPTEEKMRWYTREMGTGVSFLSNVDLFQSKAASWRDTLQVTLGPKLPELKEIPEICRNELVGWNQHTKQLGELLMELLCEGLGLSPGKLKDLTFLEARTMAAHYYPYCPQPDLTVGIKSHTDPGVLTILLQDHIGGLQVKHGEGWVDVKPVPGAIVINIGDILQILSNDEYKSNEHRVLANGCHEPRVSIAIFLNPLKRDGLFGPFPELVSPEKPALYREFLYTDYLKRFFTKELDGKSLTNYYRL